MIDSLSVRFPSRNECTSLATTTGGSRAFLSSCALLTCPRCFCVKHACARTSIDRPTQCASRSSVVIFAMGHDVKRDAAKTKWRHSNSHCLLHTYAHTDDDHKDNERQIVQNTDVLKEPTHHMDTFVLCIIKVTMPR